MLCLSGFELYSRWVPLLSFGIHNYLGKISYELRTLGLEIYQSICVP